MKVLLSIIMILVLTFSTYSQTVTVINKTTFDPVGGATIYDNNNNKIFVTTDALGKADISGLKSAVLLLVSAEGYQDLLTVNPSNGVNNFQIPLTERTYTTDEIVVSTSKFNKTRESQPQQVEILSSNKIKFWNQQTTAELLSNSGLALVQKSQLGGGSPILRGFEASRVLIMIDGIRLNNAIFRAGHLQNVLRIDQNYLERLEVLYGPGSVIYGSDALGGVMHFYTKMPELSMTKKTNFHVGAYGRYGYVDEEKTGHIDLNVGFKKVGFLASFSFTKYGDLRQGKYPNPFISDIWDRGFYQSLINNRDTMLVNDNENVQKGSGDYHQYDIMGKVLFNQSDAVQHVLNFQFSNSSDIPRFDRLTEVNASGVFRSAEWYYGPEKRLMGSYNLKLTPRQSFFNTASLVLAIQDIEESRHNRNWQASFRTDRIEKVKVYSGSLDFNKIIKQHQISFGLDGDYNDVKSTASKTNVKTDSLAPQSTRYPVDGSCMYSFAAYIMDNFKVNKYLNVTAGARYTNTGLDAKFLDTTFFKFPYTKAKNRYNAITGNLGFVVTPGDDWRIALMGSSGFRAPNIDDLAKVFETTGGVSLIVPNPDLKPENVYTGELTLSKIFERKLILEGSAFCSLLRDAIVTDAFTFNGQDSIFYNGTLTKVVANQNKNKGYIYGFTLNMNADLTNWFSLMGSVTSTYGRIKTDTVDQPLDHVPPVYGKAGMMVTLNKFRTEFSVLFNGWKHVWDYSASGEDNQIYASSLGMPAWYTLNLRASYQVHKYIGIEVGAENILDQRYRVFASGISGPGKNLYATLRLKY